jgi:RNase P/RNase MRP subunit POP5
VIKIKPLLPSLREKPRYIKYKVAQKMSSDNIYKNIKQFLGELEMAKAGVKMINNNIIRTNSKYLDSVKSALILIKGLDIIKVSGLLGRTNKIGG